MTPVITGSVVAPVIAEHLDKEYVNSKSHTSGLEVRAPAPSPEYSQRHDGILYHDADELVKGRSMRHNKVNLRSATRPEVDRRALAGRLTSEQRSNHDISTEGSTTTSKENLNTVGGGSPSQKNNVEESIMTLVIVESASSPVIIHLGARGDIHGGIGTHVSPKTTLLRPFFRGWGFFEDTPEILDPGNRNNKLFRI